MSVFPLNIPDKEDHPDKTAKLDNVASKYFETAAEINKKTKAIEENHEKILSLQSGYKGIVLIADSKTEDGDYRPGEDGVFPNCDNLVYDPLDTDKGFDVKFNLTNGVWTKYRVDLAIEKASDGEDLKDNTKFFNGKQIDIYTEGLVNSVKEVIDVDISTINKELETKVDALVGKNKFNKATITPNARIFNTGTTEPSEDGTFSVTGYMKVEGGQTYASTPPIRSFCFYDKYKNVVVGGSNDPQSSITIPNSVAFIRGTVFTSEIDTLQFEKGTSPTTYEEYKEKINNSNLDIEGFTIGKAEEGDTNPISGDALYKEVGVIDSRLEEKVSVIVGKNLFNKLDITADSQIYNTGLILAKEDGTLAVTGYMKVEEGQTYSSNPPIRRSCFYDKYKNVITGGGSDPQSSITIPNSVAFIRGTIFTTDIDTLQFEKGTPTAYEEYKEKIDNSKLDIKGFATGVSEEGNKLPISGDTLYKEIEVINKILETKISSVVGKNKFNKLDITADSQIYHTGLILPKEDGTLSVTNYMEVEEGETYASTPPIRSFCFYDKYKNVVAGGSSDPQSSVTIPNSVAFIRGTIFTTDIDTLQFEKGTPTAYEEYKEKIDNSKLDIKGFATGVSEEGNKLPISGDTLYKEIEVINKILETKISSVVGKNKFNKLDITADSQIYHTGLILPKEDGTLSVTNYMEVEEGETYASTPPIRSFCFYDKYKNVVAGGSSDPQSSVTIPNSVAFIRATVRTSELDTLQFEKGTSTTYEEYKEKIDNSKLDIEGFTIGEAEEGNTNPVSGDTLYKEIQLIKSEKGDDVFTFSLRTDVIKGIDNVLDTNDFSTPLRLKPSNVQFFEKGKKIEMDYSYKNVGKNYSLTLRSEYTHLDVEVVVLANKFISPERPTILSDGNTTMLIDSTDVDSMDITTEGRVIKWYDSINGVNLVQNIVTELSPIYTEDCILFKGDENLFSTFDTTETQNVYITYRIKKFIPTQFIFDGYTRNSASLRTNYQEDEVRLGDVSLPIQEGTEDDIHIVRMFIDGENSSYRLNNQLIKATDVGDLNMGGIVLGRPGDDDFEFEVYEVIVRKGIDSEATSDEIYTYLKDKYQVNESTYDTLAEAVYYEEPSNIKLGNVIFNKTATEPINCGKGFDFKSKKIEDAYEMVGNNGIMNHSLENPELIRFVENSINCFVFSMSDKHIYYGHGRAFYRINKHTMLDKVGFTITGALDGGVGSSTGADQITMVTETNDGNLLIQLDNNAPNSNFYKFKGTDATSGSVIYTPEDAKLVLVVNSRKVIAEGAWGMTQKDNRVFMIVYAARGQAYLSEDYGDTFKCVFSMADSAINEAVDEVDEVFVDTKPDGYGSYGKKGGHPMKDTLTNPVDFDLWGTTLNGNLHSHGGCIDPYADRLIIVTGDGAPAVGVFYSDDWGYTWTMINTQGVLIPSSDFSAQFNTVIPLKDSIIFGCDGMGDGYWRVFRDGNKLMDKVENCYQFNGESTLLVTISGGHYFHKDGTFFGIINPEADDDYNNVKGGIVATKNGHNFTKLYEDSFTLPDKATSEFAWRGLLTVNDNNEMLVSAKNGGIIKLDLVTTYNL